MGNLRAAAAPTPATSYERATLWRLTQTLLKAHYFILRAIDEEFRWRTQGPGLFYGHKPAAPDRKMAFTSSSDSAPSNDDGTRTTSPETSTISNESADASGTMRPGSTELVAQLAHLRRARPRSELLDRTRRRRRAARRGLPERRRAANTSRALKPTTEGHKAYVPRGRAIRPWSFRCNHADRREPSAPRASWRL